MDEAASPPGGSGSHSASGSFIAQADRGGTAMVTVFQATPPRPVDPAEVAAAEALLADMPLDGPPVPSGLPPGSVMPFLRNRYFTGREPDLRELACRIKEGGSAAVGQSPAVTGLGGQGKTQLAVEFAYRYGRWFKGGVFFVNCADPATMAEAVALCAPALAGDPGYSGLPLPERVALVASAWAGALPRLLIFDNCEDEALAEGWVPKSGGCRLLLTARRPSWSEARGIAILPLGKLKRGESLTLLRRHRPDLAADDSGLDSIAEELGDLPLALELAGSYLARYRHEAIGTPASYLAELRASNRLDHVSLIDDPEAPGGSRTLTGHECDIARTFAVSLDRLRAEDATDALARRLLAHAAWLAPGLPIPRFLLRRCAGLAKDDADTERLFADALGRLLDLALVEQADETGAVVLHRLVAAFARMQAEAAGETRRATEYTVVRIADFFLSRNDPTPFRGWAGHLLTMAIAAARDGTDAAVGFLNAAGSYNRMIADFGASVALLQEAAARAEAIYGTDHPALAITLGNLGNTQRARRDLAAAEASLSCVLAIFEKAYGSEHPEVARTLSNLGLVQQERGDLDAAEESLTRALAIEEAAHSPNHPALARTLGNVGLVQQARGHLAAAEASQARVLAIFEKVYGPGHPEVAKTLGNLGIVQQQRGDLTAAEASQTRALAIEEMAYGPDHPEVAATLNNLGLVQRERGDLAAAEASQTRALVIKETAYGLDNPEVAITLGNLSLVQQTLGRISEARKNCRRALAIFDVRLGKQHTHTVQARRLLAELNGASEEK